MSALPHLALVISLEADSLASHGQPQRPASPTSMQATCIHTKLPDSNNPFPSRHGDSGASQRGCSHDHRPCKGVEMVVNRVSTEQNSRDRFDVDNTLHERKSPEAHVTTECRFENESRAEVERCHRHVQGEQRAVPTDSQLPALSAEILLEECPAAIERVPSRCPLSPLVDTQFGNGCEGR